jgi:hypothetical protein
VQTSLRNNTSLLSDGVKVAQRRDKLGSATVQGLLILERNALAWQIGECTNSGNVTFRASPGRHVDTTAIAWSVSVSVLGFAALLGGAWYLRKRQRTEGEAEYLAWAVENGKSDGEKLLGAGYGRASDTGQLRSGRVEEGGGTIKRRVNGVVEDGNLGRRAGPVNGMEIENLEGGLAAKRSEVSGLRSLQGGFTEGTAQNVAEAQSGGDGRGNALSEDRTLLGGEKRSGKSTGRTLTVKNLSVVLSRDRWWDRLGAVCGQKRWKQWREGGGHEGEIHWKGFRKVRSGISFV